ncbi:LacI family DNA-binding transcriptional regulator [Loktanella sp. DJP18]|uniref:LacI family DNA-binding transcriptional regulator n=1 Tax=Loktanella sp. DJP18 TaxID=3409788 RepID=UPI003BB7CE1B
MKRAPTLGDVAALAGVSYATVDRVMNARGKVTEKVRSSVLQAVSDLGYRRNVAAANLAQRRTYRYCFVIPEGTNSFFDRVCAIVGAVGPGAGSDRVDIRISRIAAFDADALDRCLTALSDTEIDGVAFVGTGDADPPAAIAALRAKGVAVLTMVSDMPGSARDAYVGIDNVTAGRTAAGLITLMLGGAPGRVLPVVGSLAARDHAERLAGLCGTLALSHRETAPLIEGRDRHDIVETEVRAALLADPDIAAIYSAGAGNAGLIRVIADLPADRPRPCVVLHELLPHTRDGLEGGLIDIVIDQRPEEEVTQTLALLRCLADRQPLQTARQIVPAIYIRENLPDAAVPGLMKGSAA